jgi:hypothetical protein
LCFVALNSTESSENSTLATPSSGNSTTATIFTYFEEPDVVDTSSENEDKGDSQSMILLMVNSDDEDALNLNRAVFEEEAKKKSVPRPRSRN